MRIFELLFEHSRKESSQADLNRYVPMDNDSGTLLHLAIDTGDTKFALQLLDKGADINLKTKNQKRTPLRIAIEKGNNQIFDAILRKKPQLGIDDDGICALHICSDIGTSKQLEKLLTVYNQKDRFSVENPHPAIFCRTDVLKKLLLYINNGFYVNTVLPEDYDNNTILHVLIASYGSDDMNLPDPEWTKIYNLLLDHGADPHIKNAKNLSPTQFAAIKSCIPFLKIYHKNEKAWGVEQVKDKDLLFHAIAHNAVETIHYLNEIGADIHAVNRNGENAAHLAILHANLATLKILHKLGVDINAVDADNLSPIWKAVRHQKIEHLEYLLSQGCDPNASHPRIKTTLLMSSVLFENIEIVNLLLSFSVNVNLKNMHCESALHVAVTSSNTALTKLLLNAGADVNAKEQDGMTPLHIATLNNQKNQVKLLLQHQADVNIITSDGEFPLLLAIKNDNLELIKILLNAGTSKDLVKLHKTSIARATKNHPEILNLLESYYMDEKQPLQFYVDSDSDSDSDSDLALELYEHPFAFAPLHQAIDNGDTKTALQLLEQGENINLTVCDITPLMLALQKGNNVLFQAILAKKPKLDICDENGGNILHFCSILGTADQLKQLLIQWDKDCVLSSQIIHPMAMCFTETYEKLSQYIKAGINPNIQMSDKYKHDTLLHSMLTLYEKGQPSLSKDEWSQIFELLMNHGADPHIKNDDEINAIQCAIMEGCTAFLDVYHQNRRTWGGDLTKNIDLFHFAVLNKALDSILYFKSLGLDVNQANNDGLTAASIASATSSCDILKVLKNLGASFKPSGIDIRLSPLWLAVSYSKVENVAYLLKQNVDPNQLDPEFGQSLLIFAVSEGKNEIVKLLVECGAELNLKNNFGESALMIAAALHSFENTKILLEAGASTGTLMLNGKIPEKIVNAPEEIQDLLKMYRQNNKQPPSFLKGRRKGTGC